jgi:hypothetical protein
MTLMYQSEAARVPSELPAVSTVRRCQRSSLRAIGQMPLMRSARPLALAIILPTRADTPKVRHKADMTTVRSNFHFRG